MKFLISILLIFLFASGYAQSSDFIVLKRKGKTVASYYAGSQIEFTSVHNAYRNALITGISNDTLHLREYQVRYIPSTIGTYILDTIGSFRYDYHYKDIMVFGARKKGFDLKGSGAALVGGGILLLLGSGVVYLVDRDKFSPELAIGAAVLAAGGYLLSRSSNKPMVVGKRGYELQYMDMTP